MFKFLTGGEKPSAQGRTFHTHRWLHRCNEPDDLVRQPLLPPFRTGPALAIAGGSGLFMGMALPPWSLWPLAWISLVPLWMLLLRTMRQSGSLAWWLGVLWGVGFHGTALSWITHLHPLTWMGVPWGSSIAIAAFAWAFVTLWGAVTVGLWAVGLHYLWRRLPVHAPWPRVLVGTTGWCVLETLRSMTPLDWSSLALTQSPNNLWILQLARLSGQILVVVVLVGANGLLAEWLWGYRMSPAQGQRRFPLRGLLIGLGGLILGAHGLGGGILSYSPPPEHNQELRIGLIQGNVPTRIKLTSAGIAQSLTGYLEGYTSLVAQGAAAVLTPEGAIPAIWENQTAQSNPLVDAVRAAGVPLWLGTFALEPQAANRDRITQSLIEVSGAGTASGQYNKVKLVPLGEYLPLEFLLGQLISRLSPLDNYLVPGSPQQQFMTAFGPAIVGICYESAYGELFRQQARLGGEFILTASNNDPYPPRMMAQHHALDIIRAIESDRWAVRATNTGLSGVVDPQGRTQWLAEPNTYVTHLATIYRRQSQTPYGRWGSWLLPVLGSVCLVILWPVSVGKEARNSR